MHLELKAKNKREAVMMYLQVLQGFHQLTPAETRLFAELIIRFTDLRDKYDEDIANKMYLSTENRKQMKKEFKFKNMVFQNYLGTLHKKGLMTKNVIKPLFVPDFSNVKLEFNISYAKGEGPNT